MTEADVLATTYRDKCFIFRRGGLVKDPDTKQSRQAEAQVAEAVSCALSKNGSGDYQNAGLHGQYTARYTLFCRPGVDLRAGDRLLVTTEAGEQLTLWAGKPFTYAGSHMETPLGEEERT